MNRFSLFVALSTYENCFGFSVFSDNDFARIAPVISASFPVFMAGGNNTCSN